MNHFIDWLAETVQINWVSDEDYEIHQEAELVMKQVGIRPDSTKELKLVAVDNDVVIGAVYAGWHRDNDEEGEIHVFSWDIGVLPKYQGQRVGTMLIDDIMKTYRSEQGDYGDRTMVQLQVVNPRLTTLLINKYGFKLHKEIGRDQILTSE